MCHRYYMYRNNDRGPIYNRATKHDVKYIGSQWGQVSCLSKHISNKHTNHKIYLSYMNYCPTVLYYYLRYLNEIRKTEHNIRDSLPPCFFFTLILNAFFHYKVKLLYSRSPYLLELPLIVMFAVLLIFLACCVIYRKCKKQEGK